MEQFANEASAALDGAINNSVTTLTVKSPTRIPAAGTFRARIDNEIVKVTGVSGLTWTIVRGDGSTTAASHVDSATITVVVTKEAVDALVTVQSAGSAIGDRRILNFVGATVADDAANSRVNVTTYANPYGEALTPPVLANFTLDGHSIAGTPTATTQGNSIYIYHPGTNGDAIVELYQTAPATPYTVIAKVVPFGLTWTFPPSMGLYFGDGTKLQRLSYQLNSGAIVVDKYSAWNTFSATTVTQAVPAFGPITWLKIRDSGSAKTFHVSFDGQNWLQVYSGLPGEYLFATTRIGVAVNGYTGGANTGKVVGALVQSWQVLNV